jgi:hypothetical protein
MSESPSSRHEPGTECTFFSIRRGFHIFTGRNPCAAALSKQATTLQPHPHLCEFPYRKTKFLLHPSPPPKRTRRVHGFILNWQASKESESVRSRSTTKGQDGGTRGVSILAVQVLCGRKGGQQRNPQFRVVEGRGQGRGVPLFQHRVHPPLHVATVQVQPARIQAAAAHKRPLPRKHCSQGPKPCICPSPDPQTADLTLYLYPCMPHPLKMPYSLSNPKQLP